MELSLIQILSFLIGGGGIVTLSLAIRKERQATEIKKREKILSEEFSEEKGAGLLITTSSEAIAVFKIALETANNEARRLREERDELFARVRALEARVRELEGKIEL